MTVSVNKLLQISSSRFLCLLFLFILINCSNKSEKNTSENNSVFSKKILSTKSTQNDSLEITVHNIPSSVTVSFMYNDVDFNNQYISFENKSKEVQTLSRKILKPTKFSYSLLYRSFTAIDNKVETYYHDYYIDKNAQKLEFLFDEKNGDVQLQNRDSNVIIYDDITRKFQQITKRSNHTSVSQKIQKIQELHQEFQKKFNTQSELLVNDLVFYKQLSLLSPADNRIKEYLEGITDPVWGTDLSIILHQFLQTKKENIYSLHLNKTENKIYNKLMEVGVSNHLQQYNDKKYTNYNKNLIWFKKNTEYYKNNKKTLDKLLGIEKEIKSIRDDILSFDLHKEGRVVKLESIADRKSPYYLLDFWATWCVPCLQNIEAIHNMDLPEDLEIIYISMDRTKDREKWSKKSQDFNLSNSYLFAETENNKTIITKIGLNQLPRYILIDKDFNILNSNLATPQETDFLKELEMYINK